MEIGSSGINGSCIIRGQILSPITAAESISSRPLAKQDAAYGRGMSAKLLISRVIYEKKINASATETLYYTRDLLHSGDRVSLLLPANAAWYCVWSLLSRVSVCL